MGTAHGAALFLPNPCQRCRSQYFNKPADRSYRSFGVIEGTIGSIPEDKRTVITRLEKLELGQTGLNTGLKVLSNALGDSPRDLMLAAEKVKDNFVAFDQLRADVAGLTGQFGQLRDTLDEINEALNDKESGLITQVSGMNQDIQTIKRRLGIETP